MRHFMRIVEAAEAPLLYHTTSASGAIEILTQHKVRPARNKETGLFVSFSEVPLIGHPDIAASDVSIGFHPYAFWGRIERVIYSEEWYNENRERAAYVAGEGWYQQWEPPEDAYDDEGFEDEDVYGEAHQAAELDAFLDKFAEHEWISREPQDMNFNPADVVVLIVEGDVADWQAELASIGYHHVRVVQKGHGT